MHVPFLLASKLILLNFLLLVWEHENNGHQKVLTSSGIKNTWHFQLHLQMSYVSSGPRLSLAAGGGVAAGTGQEVWRAVVELIHNQLTTLPALCQHLSCLARTPCTPCERRMASQHRKEPTYLVSSPFNLLTPRRSCHIINLEENNFSKLHLEKSTPTFISLNLYHFIFDHHFWHN